MRLRTVGVLGVFLAIQLLCSSHLSGQSVTNPGPLPSIHAKNASGYDLVDNQKYVPNQLLVRFRPEITSAMSNSQKAQILQSVPGAVLQKAYTTIGGLQLVRLPQGTSVTEAISTYLSDSRIEYAEPNFILKKLAGPNDPLFPRQWGLQNNLQIPGRLGADIDALTAWQVKTDASNIVIAVIDSGVDYTHPDLVNNIFRNEADCNSNGVDDDGDGYIDDCHGVNTFAHTSDPADDNGHGTHVSGIIGASGNNGVGVSGVAWSVKILACKFLDETGYGTTDAAIECLDYVKTLKDRGVNIVATNNSWGGGQYSQALYDAIDAQRQSGILFIAASGNDFSNNDDIPVYPATYGLPNIVSVAATNSYDEISGFSNLGPQTVHLGAPGQEVLSTFPNVSYATASGSSMAAPFVSGTVALVSAANPTWDWRQIKNVILASTDPLGLATITNGRLNAAGALSCSGRTLARRLRPIGTTATVTIGSPLLITYMNVNCGQPAGPVSASMSTGSQIPLVDDGTGADIAGGDGIYSGSWTPTAIGSYQLTMPDGEKVSVQVLTPYFGQAVVPAYRNISGTSLDLGDDSVAQINSPFPIPFGGGSFTDLWISSNGTVSFTEPFFDFTNSIIPTGLIVSQSHPGWSGRATTLVAPLWNDWFPMRGTQENVFWEVTGSAPHRELVVEWRDVRTFRCNWDGTTSRFEVVFREDSPHVRFEFADLSLACSISVIGGTSIVGLQTSSTDGMMLHSGKLLDNKLIGNSAYEWSLVTESLPDNPVPVITQIEPSYVPYPFEDQWITVRGQNFVPGSQVFLSSLSPVTTKYISATELRFWLRANSGITSSQVKVFNPKPGGGWSRFMPFRTGSAPTLLTSITPSSVPAGSSNLIVDLIGINLSGASDVRFENSDPLRFQVISDTEIRATIPAAQLASPGVFYIGVYKGDWSNFLPFAVTAVGSSQRASTYWDSRFGPRQSDLRLPSMRFLGWRIAPQMDAEYGMRFPKKQPNLAPFMPQATGLAEILPSSLGLQLRPTFKAGYLPTAVVHGDFNHDGKMDWAISMGGDSTVWIYLGHGDGTFDTPSIIPLQGQSPVSMVTADLNGDGNLDLILGEADSGTVGVLLGRSDGTFEAEELSYIPTPVFAVAAADFNGDGKIDVAAGIYQDLNFGAVAMLPGDGTGHLLAPQMWPSDPFLATPVVLGLAVGDFNKDGHPDLVTIDYAYGDLPNALVYLNTGDGHFKMISSVGYAVSVAVADFNEDGLDDIAVQSIQPFVYVAYGNGNGSFRGKAEEIYGEGSYGQIVMAADFNGDGHMDIATSPVAVGSSVGYGQDSGSMLTVLLGNGGESFGPQKVYKGSSSAFGADAFDINGDGRPEIVAANQDYADGTIYFNAGNGTFDPPNGEYIGYITPSLYAEARHTNAPRSKAIIADVNGDGRSDVVAIAITPKGFDIISALQAADGTFPEKRFSNVSQSTAGFALDAVVGDFRNTGKQDAVLMLNYPSGEHQSGFVFAAAQADGSFVPAQFQETSLASGFAVAMATGDFNGDGKLDFAGVGSIPNALVVFLGNGDGTFQAQSPITIPTDGNQAVVLYARDFTGDGKLDLLAWFQQKDAMLFEGNGDGTFKTQRTVLPGTNFPFVGDVNKDGLPDVLDFPTTPEGAGTGTVRVRLCQTGGTFTEGVVYPIPDAQYFDLSALEWGLPGRGQNLPALADFDGDGNLDILTYPYELRARQRVWAQFLKGNGDGTFVVQPSRFDLRADMGPTSAADMDGDGRAELIELDGRTSSFHIIKTTSAPALQLSLLGNPVSTETGIVRVSLSTPQTTDVVINLSSTDTSITLPPSITIAAGSISRDISFGVSPRPASARTFTILARSGTSAASVTGTLASVQDHVGVEFELERLPAYVPGEVVRLDVNVRSLGGYTGDVILSCENVPSNVTCQISPATVHFGVSTLQLVQVTFDISSSAAPGRYTPTLVATDGAGTWTKTLDLRIGDFTIRVPEPVRTYAIGTTDATYDVYVDLSYLEPENVVISCEGLPTPTPCRSSGSNPTVLTIDASLRSVGTYPFKIIGWARSMTHSVDATLTITDKMVTTSATDLTGISAVLHGTGNPSGQPMTAWFEYGTNSALSDSTRTPVQTLGSGTTPVAISAAITSLSPNTTYYYRIVGMSGSTNLPGATLNFRTSLTGDVTLRPSQTQLDFGTQQVNGRSGNRTISLGAGDNVVTISNIVATGDFQQTNNCGTSIAARSGCDIQVTFVPTTTGSRTGTITVQSNAIGSPHTINLSGTGTDFTMTTSGNSTMTVPAGNSATYSLAVSGSQGFVGTLTLSCANLPPYAECQFPSGTLPVNGTSTQTINLTVTTKTVTYSSALIGGMFLATFLIPGLFVVGHRKSRNCKAIFYIALVVCAAALLSCGGGGGGNNPPPPPVTHTTPPGTYTITVQAQSGNLSHTQSVTLVVQ